MDILLALAQFLVNEILSVPAYLIGLITAIGLIALRKTAGQVIGSALKAVLGFLLIGAGATLVTASLTPLGVMIQGALGAQGVVPTNEAIAGIAQAEFGAQVAWLMILGFVVAILLARFTPLRYVFLTGHHLLFMATLITIVMASAGMPGPIVVVLGALLLGILMVCPPSPIPGPAASPGTTRSRSGTSGPPGTSPPVPSAGWSTRGAGAGPPRTSRSPSRCGSCAIRWWPPPCRWC